MSVRTPEADPTWQESFVLFLWDPVRKVYAFLRIGHEPNRESGFTAVWLNVWTPDVIYKHTDDSIPLGAGDVGERHLSSGGGLCRYEYDGRYHWTVTSADVQLQVVMTNHHPGFSYYPDGVGAAITQSSKHHIEAMGKVVGTVTVKGKTYEIAGTGWRDHSWGNRQWSSLLTHRDFPAMFGPDFGIFAVTMVGIDGNLIKLGTIIRGDTVEATSDFDIVAYMDVDGVSNCGGQVRLRTGGETLTLDYQPIGKGAISFHHAFPCVDTMCLVTMGNRTGVGLAETSTRPQGGFGRPHVFPSSHAILENGLHPVPSPT